MTVIVGIVQNVKVLQLGLKNHTYMFVWCDQLMVIEILLNMWNCCK